MACSGAKENAAVFDIGGTWFRSAVATPAGLADSRRSPAIGFRQHPGVPPRELQARLIDYLIGEAARAGCSAAVISMGAALNAHTGFIYDSGPLWGADCEPFDLRGALAARAPAVDWHVINDVTAALLAHVASLGPRRHGRTMLITVSSGIGARVFDFERGTVPVDPVHGLQGEIGHLPVEVSFDGRAVTLACDCGGADHLNAFASGRGLEALARHLAARGDSYRDSELFRRCGGAPPDIGAFLAAVRSGDAWSRAVLSAALRPLAHILLTLLTHDPELDPIVLVGGVATTLGETLRSALLDHLEALGLYQVLERDPGYFSTRLRLGAAGDDGGLRGCAEFARQGREAAR